MPPVQVRLETLLRKPIPEGELAIVFMEENDCWLGAHLPGDVVLETFKQWKDGKYDDDVDRSEMGLDSMADFLKGGEVITFETGVDRLECPEHYKQQVRDLIEAAFVAGMYFERKNPQRFSPDDGSVEEE